MRCAHPLLSGFSIAFVVAFGARAGELAPPVGPVAPTMKDLDTVEPRIPIGPDTTPGNATNTYHIDQSGSYYLTGNLAGESGKNGIGINADNVTIDLNGFSLVGASDSLDGIAVLGSPSGLALKVSNGNLRHWEHGVFSASFFCLSSEFEDLYVSECRSDGIRGGFNCRVSRCVSLFNAGSGVDVLNGAIVSDCIVMGLHDGTVLADGISTGSDSLVIRCRSSDNTASGIVVGLRSVVRDCVATGNDWRGVYSFGQMVLERCEATFNGYEGIRTGDASIVSDCTALANTENGITAGDSVVLSGCRMSSNGLLGLQAGVDAHIEACVANDNGSQGFWIGSKGLITGCRASFNGLQGIVGGASAAAPSGLGCSIIDCIAEGNGTVGVLAPGGSTVRGSLGQGNGTDGFISSGETRFVDCAAISNGQRGFATNASVLEGCSSSSNGAEGYSVGSTSRVVRCVSRVDRGTGFEANQDSSFEACKAANTLADGTTGSGDGFNVRYDCTFISCEATGCAGAGFEGIGQVTYETCRATENQDIGFKLGFGGDNGAFILNDCVANMNSGGGVFIEDPFNSGVSGSIVRSCAIGENSLSGLVVPEGASVLDCVVSANSVHGIVTTGQGVTIARCTVDKNGDRGISAFSRTKINGCTIRINGNHGIYADNQCHIIDNMVTDNGDGVGTEAGIRVFEGCRIEGNAITQNGGHGVTMDDNRNVVVRNTFALNGGPQLNDVNGNNQNALPPTGAAVAGPWDNISH